MDPETPAPSVEGEQETAQKTPATPQETSPNRPKRRPLPTSRPESIVSKQLDRCGPAANLVLDRIWTAAPRTTRRSPRRTPAPLPPPSPHTRRELKLEGGTQRPRSVLLRRLRRLKKPHPRARRERYSFRTQIFASLDLTSLKKRTRNDSPGPSTPTKKGKV